MPHNLIIYIHIHSLTNDQICIQFLKSYLGIIISSVNINIFVQNTNATLYSQTYQNLWNIFFYLGVRYFNSYVELGNDESPL